MKNSKSIILSSTFFFCLLGLVSCSFLEPTELIKIRIADEHISQAEEFQNWMVTKITEGRVELSHTTGDNHFDLVVSQSSASKIRNTLSHWEKLGSKSAPSLAFHLLHPNSDLVAKGNEEPPPGFLKLNYRETTPQRSAIVAVNQAISTMGAISRADAVLGQTGWYVSVEFDEKLHSIVESVTTANLGKPIAIVVDNEILSAPVIEGAFRTGCQISGSFTKTEAEELATSIQTPPPIPFTIIN